MNSYATFKSTGRRLKVAVCITAGALALLLSAAAQADLIIKNGATLTVEPSAVLDVNCSAIDLQTGGVFNLTSATVEDVLDFTQNGSFNNAGGVLAPCLPGLNKSYSPSTITATGVSVVTYTITNDTTSVASGLSFSDLLDQQAPLAELVVATPANVSNTCGGTLSANSGDSTISLSGGSVPATNSCIISVDVTSGVAGTYDGATSDLTSNLGSGNPARAQLEVRPLTLATPPSFNKTFAPSTIGPGSVSTLTFTILNSSNELIEQLAFVDSLPASITIANPASVSTTCLANDGSTVNAPNGGGTISLAGYSVLPASSCTISVDVTSSTAGTHMNVTGDLTSNAGNSGTATADLTVATDRPGFSASFSPSTINLGDRTTLVFTIDNSANANALSSLSFTNELPSGSQVALPSNASSTCAGPNPQLMAMPGETTLSFSSFGILFPGFEVLLAGETCTITLDLIANTSGVFENTSSVLSTNVGDAGRASAPFTVNATTLGLTHSFSNDPVAPGGTVISQYIINNRDRVNSASNIAFTHDLSATLAGITINSLLGNSCGGALSGIGTSALSLNGASAVNNASCQISLELQIPAGAATGIYASTTSAITGDLNGSPTAGNLASEQLFISTAPIVTTQFTPASILNGEPATLEYTITNTSATSSATDVTLGTSFPSELITASTTPTNGSCGIGSTFSFSPQFNPPSPSNVVLAMLQLTGGTLAPAGMSGDSCTFTITLDGNAGSTPGLISAVTTAPTATVDGLSQTGQMTSAELTIVSGLSLRANFTDNPVSPGDMTTLEFQLSYADEATADATDITFTNDLNATLPGLFASLPATPNPVCGTGSSLTGSASDTFLTLQGGVLSPGESCTFSVDVTVPVGAPSGTVTNASSAVTATINGTPVTFDAVNNELIVSGLLFTQEFIGSPAIAGEQVLLRFTFENNDPSNNITSISFNNNLSTVLPGVPDLTVGTLPSTPCGPSSTISLLGGSFIQIAGAELNSGDSCTFDVPLTVPLGARDGDYINATSNVTATIDGAIAILPASSSTLTINSNPLSLTHQFSDDPVAAGETATIEYTIVNGNSINSTMGITFNHSLENVLTGLLANGLPSVDVCGAGSNLAVAVGGIELSNASLSAGASCTFALVVQIPANTESGTYASIVGEPSGSVNGLPVGGSSVDDELVVQNISVDFSKSFATASPIPGGTTSLSYTITNNSSVGINSVRFSEMLTNVVSGLSANNLPLNDVCGSGSIAEGSGIITVSNISLPANGSCTFDVGINVPAAATPGVYPSSSSPLSSLGTLLAAPANADLTIVALPPLFNKTFTPSSIQLEETSRLEFSIDNSASPDATTALDFSDNFPAGLRIAGTPNASVTCSGGTLTAVPNTPTLSYTGGAVNGAQQCLIAVDVMATSGATLNNVSGDLTSSLGNSGNATATLVVTDVDFTKSFGATPPTPGTTTTLSYTIANNSDVAVGSLLFSDSLTSLVGGLSTNNLPLNDVCGSGSIAQGDGVITVNNISLAANQSCSFVVGINVPAAATPGVYPSSSSALTSLGTLFSPPASDDLIIVAPPPLFSKTFTPSSIQLEETSRLEFTIDNSASPSATTTLNFSDNFPAGLRIADTPNAIVTCSGGTLTAAPSASTLSYTGGTVSAAQQCRLSIDVMANTVGMFTNVSSDLTSSLGSSGNATATLTVGNDRDGDGISNDVDNCPFIANADQANLDRDEQGNACDLDDDGDGMPDAWEIANGLNPLNSFDQRGDPDRDGFTNLQEFEFGTDPNEPDTDNNSNGIPDIVEQRRNSVVPAIITPLLLDD